MTAERYSCQQLQQFLDVVDDCLDEEAELVLLGGSAVILSLGVTTTTVDIDTFNQTTAALMAAVDRARERTGLNIPVRQSGVAQVPYKYEDRLVPHTTAGQFLRLSILERHDLAISKALRADERDRQHLRSLHQRDPLDFEILVPRFSEEMIPIYVGDKARAVDYFLWVVEELFGDLWRARAEGRIENV